MTEQDTSNEDILFEDYGITVFKRSGKFFIRYDAGELVVRFEEVEVSEQQGTRAQLGERQAYEVLLEVEQSRKRVK